MVEIVDFIQQVRMVVDKTLIPKSIDYPHGLPIWITQKWTTLLKFSD